jgi:hypothetical protein
MSFTSKYSFKRGYPIAFFNFIYQRTIQLTQLFTELFFNILKLLVITTSVLEGRNIAFDNDEAISKLQIARG